MHFEKTSCGFTTGERRRRKNRRAACGFWRRVGSRTAVADTRQPAASGQAATFRQMLVTYLCKRKSDRFKKSALGFAPAIFRLEIHAALLRAVAEVDQKPLADYGFIYRQRTSNK